MRKAYWVAFASGYAWAWPDAHYEVVVGDPPRTYDAEYYGVQGQAPILADLKRMSAFLAESKLDLARLAPLRRIVSQNDQDVYTLANPAGEYVAVFPFGGKAVIQLADAKAGRYDTQFYQSENRRVSAEDRSGRRAASIHSARRGRLGARGEEEVGGSFLGSAAEADPTGSRSTAQGWSRFLRPTRAVGAAETPTLKGLRNGPNTQPFQGWPCGNTAPG